jgi:hypothetical protein
LGLFTSIGKYWLINFIKRHDDLIFKYIRRYDYQRVKCEDPKIINQWFNLVQNTIVKYGIFEHDIHNFAEAGFQVGVVIKQAGYELYSQGIANGLLSLNVSMLLGGLCPL